MSEPRHNTAIRFPAALHEWLTTEAAARSMPLNTFVCRLLEESRERLIPASELRLTRPPTPNGEEAK